MKTKSLFLSLLMSFPFVLFAQGSWTQKANFPLPGRQYANGFSIGNKGYYVFGCYLNNPNSVNLVEYDPSTNAWTQKTNFPGNTRIMSHVFVIDTLAYFVSGAYWSGVASNYTGYNDMWVYNPYNDSWTQLNNFPGTARHGAFAFSYAGEGYFGLGIDENLHYLSDFWKYNPATDTWIQRASFPGIKRKNGFQFSISKNGYVGLGYDSTSTALSDVWRYDAGLDSWYQMNNFPADPRCWVSSLSMNNMGFIVTGYLLNSHVNTKQFWEYDPNFDTWSAMPDFSGAARCTASAFSVSGKAYNGMGYSSTYLNDFWEFTPTVGIQQTIPEDKTEIKVFPDPASDQFNIEVPRLTLKNNRLSIIDISGRIVMTIKIDGNPQLVSVDCSSWAHGKYFLVLNSQQEKQVSSITIE
jgi:N-acetylneuraminic acid mutarotase